MKKESSEVKKVYEAPKMAVWEINYRSSLLTESDPERIGIDVENNGQDWFQNSCFHRLTFIGALAGSVFFIYTANDSDFRRCFFYTLETWLERGGAAVFGNFLVQGRMEKALCAGICPVCPWPCLPGNS